MKRTVFAMEPFSCPSCIKKIESTLLKTDGVKTAKVLFNAGKVRVEFDSSATSPDALGNLINKLGYATLSQKTTAA